MTPERRAELQRLCDAAVPAPWVECCPDQPEFHPCRLVWSGPMDVAVVCGEIDGTRTPKGTMRFVAAARSAVPELLAEVELLTGAVGLLRAECGQTMAARNEQERRHLSALAERDSLRQQLEAARADNRKVSLVVADLHDQLEAAQRTEAHTYIALHAATAALRLIAPVYRAADPGTRMEFKLYEAVRIARAALTPELLAVIEAATK